MIDATAIAEAFGRIVQTACLCALPILFGICGVVWLHEHDIYLLRKFKGMFKSARGVIVAIVIAVFIVQGGSKAPTNFLQSLLHEPLQASRYEVVTNSRVGIHVGGGESTNETVYALTQNQIDAGFVLARIGTNETYDFSAPDGATVYDRWRRRGANINRFSINFTAGVPWEIPFGTNFFDGLTIYSTGVLLPKAADEARVALPRLRDALPAAMGVEATGGVLAPFRANLGVIPEMNWGRLPANAVPSEVWWVLTPSNSVVVTYENVLLGRDTNTPVCVQVEFFENGNFAYRYDLSRAGLWNGENVTNVLVGAFNGGHGEYVDVSAITNLTTLFWHRLEASDTPTGDRDGDGLSTAEEIFRTRTDPGLLDTDGDGVSDGEEDVAGTNPLSRDTDSDGLVDGSDPDPSIPTPLTDLDGDGIPDAYEAYWFGGTNAFDTATSRDETGFTLDTKILGGINPTNAVVAANVISTNSLVSWKLFDGFAADWPVTATNLVWERAFSINRTSTWQQFFVSSAPTNAAPWILRGMVLEWETDDGLAGTLADSPVGDSFRLPLGTNDFPSVLTLRLRATGAHLVHSPMPLYLIAYSPEFRIEGGQEITGQSGEGFSVFMHGSKSDIQLVVDHSRRPHRAPLGADESDIAFLENISMTSGGLSFAGDLSGGALIASGPGFYELPVIPLGLAATNAVPLGEAAPRRFVLVLDPSVWWKCNSHGCGYDGLGYDWYDESYYEKSYYPLDSKCLRKKWYRHWDGGWNHGNCELEVSSGLEDGDGCVTASVDGNNVGKVYVDGVPVWSGTAEHVYDDVTSAVYSEDFLGDGCDSCDADCADGTCDSLEGASLGSLRFRIPLGQPEKGQVAGFAWFMSDEPTNVTKSTFQVLAHPDATITDTTAAGTRRITCGDSRGRDLRIEDIPNGVRITIYKTAEQTLEHTWEITNVNGDSAQVRLKKISRLDNVMSDETFTYDYGDWIRFDHVAQIGTRLTVSGGFSVWDDGAVSETRTTYDAAGNPLGTVTTEKSRVGECDNAVLRETYRSEYDGNSSTWTQADYWDDPQHAGRHGQPRLVQGNSRAWVYTDYDENGHETLRVEQRGNTPVPADFPYVISNELYNASTLADAFVTVRDYEPLDGDSCHPDDAAKWRTETRYVVTNGVLTLTARTLNRYTRLTHNGHPAIKHETWHPASQSPAATFQPFNLSTFQPAIAYSYAIDYATTGEDTPFLMRGAVAEALSEDGTLTVNAYSLSGGVLSRVSRKSRLSRLLPTYETTETDATYGTLLRATTRLTANDAIIDDEQSIYDDQNRLRSTTYFDGTSLTNAYSCCRLLWSRDRQNRTTLRSAQTGTDHLYNATEEIWLTNLTGITGVSPVGGSGNTGTTGVSPVGGSGVSPLQLGYRITQHYYDALGRETNTVVSIGSEPGAAVSQFHNSILPQFHTSTIYPSGGSSYSIHTDERGAITTTSTYHDPDYTEQIAYTTTNQNTWAGRVHTTTTRTYHGGGSSTRGEWTDVAAAPSPSQKWTEERRFTDYAPNGYRIDYIVTTSSDHYNLDRYGAYEYVAITNSISTYDLLGRLVTTAVPAGGSGVTPLQSGPPGGSGVSPLQSGAAWLVTSNAYDGATSRILTTTRYAPTLEPRTTTYLYNDWGEQVGTVLDGITNRTDTTYEQFSNEWWKVETSTVIGPSTNSLTITRTQLTGLSDSCRRHTITISGTQGGTPIGEAALSSLQIGTVTDNLTTYDPSTGIETETITSSTGPAIIRRSLYGILISTETSGETTYNSYDALARVVATSRTGCQPVQEGTPIGEAALLPLQSYTYTPAGDLLATHTYTNGTGYTTETYAYDLLGNRIATTDALGNTTYRTYDPLGNLTAEWGATYPVRYTYDPQGRRTSLTTFRTTGAVALVATEGDTTTWAYDPATGNCLSKTYADGSTIAYTYTPDNLLLRTTYASGKWKENVYDTQRRLCGVVYSSSDMDYEFQLDAYGRTVWESNSVCSVGYALADAGTVTNEVVSVGDETMSIARTLDGQDRLVGLTIPDSGYEANYAYANDGNIESISNDLACVSYLYSSNRLDVGYSIRLANGTTIQRNLYRDEHRRSLVTNITTVVNGNNVETLTYAFDAASRPIARNGDTFGYNVRSEVVSATISGNSETHEYDNIGNSIRASFNAVTNTFVANNLNQYTAINRNTLPLWETSHDIDGNMTQCGDWTYAYDAGHQLKSVSSNGVLLVTNYYDAKSRRVQKVTPNATMTFFYDDWNLIEERVACTNGTTSTIRYYWGKDLSGGLQGAGGVGGLLYLTVDGVIYIPCYDNIGNVTRYIDANGNTVAQYTYDAFGNIISQSGPLADFFRHRFSTKYFDSETDLYYYGFRFSHPILMRWLNRDPLEEEGGINLYLMCNNNPYNYDVLGLWSATRESYGDTRRVYKKDDGDTIKGLAKKIEMDESTFNLWARVETKPKISSPNGGVPAPNSDAGLKNVCYISVPNVWIEADLLRGGGVFARFVNLGGTIGSFFGQTLGRWGYYTCQPTTPVDLQNTVMMNYQNLYGLTVYAHGSTDGRIGNPQGEQIHQKNLINIISANRYRIAKANMMQCYSLIPNGTIRLGQNREIPFNYKEAWNKTAVKVYGYEGINFLLINYNKKK